jgi:hypothetical protein
MSRFSLPKLPSLRRSKGEPGADAPVATPKPRRRRRRRLVTLNKGRGRMGRWSRDRRRAVLIVSSVICTILFAWIATGFGLGYAVRASVGCSSCHQCRVYVDAHLDSGHKDVSCASCHARKGVFGMLADGLRAQRWTVLTPFVKSVQPVDVGDMTCRRCHAAALEDTTVSKGIRVRHSDFIDVPCRSCHSGSGHAIKDRWYIGSQMQDCMDCHRTTVSRVSTCDECHVATGATSPTSTAAAQAGISQTTWRATHGAGWKKSHGMGDLTSCKACHLPGFCEKCHGIPVPHPTDWPQIHGTGVDVQNRKACYTCHKAEWCVACHGVEMPHGPGFLPQHPQIAKKVGTQACSKCHDPQACDVCHYQSSHPHVPGLAPQVHTSTSSNGL